MIFMANVLNNSNFDNTISNGVTLVDFWAEWCGPCKMMKPILEKLHQEMSDKIRIIKIDIDKSPAAAKAYQVQSVPTLVLIQKGRTLWRQAGVLQANQLKNIIEIHTKSF